MINTVNASLLVKPVSDAVVSIRLKKSIRIIWKNALTYYKYEIITADVSAQL